MNEPTSIGAHLRAARRKRRIGIERAAEDTKIRADFLMRMESDELDFLAPAYVRGFLRSYARFLGLDPAPLTTDFDRRYGNPKTDTSSLVEIERRVRRAPKQRKATGNWSIAAALAAGVLLFLGVLGLIQGPVDEQSPNREGPEREASATTPRPSPSPSAKPRATPQPSPTETLAAVDGVRLTVDAITGDCWIDVTADGRTLFSETLPVGSSRTFRAKEEMTVVLGYPAGVELIVNGRNLGVPGDENPITVQLPDDIDTL